MISLTKDISKKENKKNNRGLQACCISFVKLNTGVLHILMLRKFGCIGRSDSPTIRACGREISKVVFYTKRGKRKKMNHKKYHVLNISDFENQLKKCCPNMKSTYRTIVDDNGIKKQVPFYEFPSLDLCRKAFERAMGCKIDWPEV